jgi:glyoxylase-like metal-dependent hydrolase (beta-lactamase superfamily II)
MNLKFPFLRAAVLAAAVSLAAAGAQAGAPQQKTQVPGWFRTMVGDFEVTALFDGALGLDPAPLLKNTRPGEIGYQLRRAYVPGPKVQTSVNAFLVNTGTQLILVDTGAAQAFGPGMGHVIEYLKSAGYEPSQVDVVLLTHLHGDHAAGLLTADGQPAFPNAKVMLSAPEAAYWLDDAQKAKAPKEMQGFFDIAKAAAAPYQAAGRWQTFAPNAALFPGVQALATGHTPGHSSYVFESQGHKLVVLGDVIHFGAVQFPHPEAAVKFDSDSAAAIASRKHLFAQAAREGSLLAGAHLDFPGLGHVRAEGRGYAWVPLPYAPLPAGQ